MKLGMATLALSLIAFLPNSVQAAEAWNCKITPYRDGIWRAEGNLFFYPKGDFGQPPGVPIVKNNNDILVAMSENAAPGIDLVLIDKRASKIAVINMGIQGRVFDHANGSCTKVE